MIPTTQVWSATDFFERLTASNKLAVEKGFRFVQVSGLEGLEQAVGAMQSTANFVFVVENAAGFTELDNSPRQRKIRSVFFAMRHKYGDMKARRQCMDIMAELFRQFCSVLIQQERRFEENMQYLDTRINMQEVSQHLIPGTAMCMFEIAVDTFINLEYDAREWITQQNN